MCRGSAQRLTALSDIEPAHAFAILEAWLPGEEGGHAIADVLFGAVSPAGRLPVTFPRSSGQLPLYYNHKPSGARSQFHGNYSDLSCSPLFPFGHGLSYTDFEYSDLSVSEVRSAPDARIEIGLRRPQHRAARAATKWCSSTSTTASPA